jgi:hypothetical protein
MKKKEEEEEEEEKEEEEEEEEDKKKKRDTAYPTFSWSVPEFPAPWLTLSSAATPPSCENPKLSLPCLPPSITKTLEALGLSNLAAGDDTAASSLSSGSRLNAGLV